METSADYVNHLNIVKELNLYTTIRENQREYEKGFEEIYRRVKDEDVKLSSAKEFLNDLSRSELRTLQKFEGLAEAIDVDTLSDEGAYNLLVHRYEKYDWDNDGTTQIGAAKVLMSIPKNMDDDAKKAWVQTLNELGDDFMAVSVISMSLNDEYNKRQIAEQLSQMSESQRAKLQESANFNIDQFIQDTLSKPYTPELITVQDILDKVDNILNPKNGGYSSPEMLQSTMRLQDELTKAYAEIQAEKKEQLSTQKEFEIKQEALEKSNEQKEEPLAVAIKEISRESKSAEDIIKEYRAMPGQAGIAYEGMFEKQIAEKLARREPFFKAEYPLYEKYKDVFTPIYSNYTREKAESIGRALDAQFPEFQAMRDKSRFGGTQEDKDAFMDMFWDYQAYNKYLREKYNLDMDGGIASTQEATKAYNFAVYEQLEKGVDLATARAAANGVQDMFGGAEGYYFGISLFSGVPTDMEEAMDMPDEEIDYNTQIDLRKEGFEHNFWSTDYLEIFGTGTVGIKSRILYDIELYSFLLENDELVDQKLDELKERAYENTSTKEWYDWRNSDGKFNDNFKSQFKPAYEKAILAKEIYDKYSDKIFTKIEEELSLR